MVYDAGCFFDWWLFQSRLDAFAVKAWSTRVFAMRFAARLLLPCWRSCFALFCAACKCTVINAMKRLAASRARGDARRAVLTRGSDIRLGTGSKRCPTHGLSKGPCVGGGPSQDRAHYTTYSSFRWMPQGGMSVRTGEGSILGAHGWLSHRRTTVLPSVVCAGWAKSVQSCGKRHTQAFMNSWLHVATSLATATNCPLSVGDAKVSNMAYNC